MDSVATDAPAASTKPWMLWTGRVMSAIPVLMLLVSGIMKLVQPANFVEQFVNDLGFSQGLLLPIGVLELCCVVLYLVPRTAVLGALLVGCYLAAAFVTHVRIGEASAVMPVLLGVMAWGGLWLREPRLRALLPLRS